MRAVSLCSLLLLLALNGCTRAPADKLKAEIQTVNSWTATARMASEAWLKGTVPHAYATHTLRTAQEMMEDEAQTIQEESQAGAAELQTSLINRVRGLGQLIDRMRAAIEKRDNEALSQLLKQLEAEDQTIKELAKSGGAQP
jgi:hypothetical protein